MKCSNWGWVLLGMAIAVSGCTKSDQPAENSEKGKQLAAVDTKSASPAAPAEKPATRNLSSNVPKRSSFVGRWIVLFYQRGTAAELPAALIEISPTSGGSSLRAKLLQFGISLTNPTLKGLQATEKSVHFVVEMSVQQNVPGRPPVQGRRQADVLVELNDGFARGNAQFNPVETFLVAMVPTELDNIQELRAQMLTEARDLVIEEQPKDAKPEQVIAKLGSFVKAHPQSPITIDVYPVLFKTAAERMVDEAMLRAMSEKFIAASSLWGARQALRARVEIASDLVATGYQLPLAIKQIDGALSQLNEETIPIWKADLEELKQAATAGEALSQIEKGSTAEKQKAAAILRHRNEVHPYDPMILFQLARYDEEHGQKASALQKYAKLAVLPMMNEILADAWSRTKQKHPTPRASAEKLWKEQHEGKADGFEKFLDQVYVDSMPKFTEKPVEPRPHDPENRVVLFELFTGTGCPPCVAADVAFSHVLKTYRPTEVIALQYHQNIPQPDPLANEDTTERLKSIFPDRAATPTLFVSGQGVQLAGFLAQTTDVYSAIRQLIDRTLSKKTTVKIHLSARPKGSAVAVTAEAEGSFPPNEPIRMRLALAEERVFVRGGNGIREHEMVVRAMPGGPRGIEIRNGKLRYDGTVDLREIREKLDDYLKGLEEKNKAAFPVKPINLTHLHLVAFVQNDQSGEVYQAATIPFPSAGPATANEKRDATAVVQRGKRVPAAESPKASP